jgi:glycine cleavage system H lipoate-binding protein
MMRMQLHWWTKKRMNKRTFLGAVTVAAAAFATMLFVVTPPAGSAQINVQNTRKAVPIERIATGKVVSKAGSPIGGAVVYLKNTRTNAVRTYIADDDGQFRFGELSQDTDYEIWAESEGVRSKSRGISSFDSQTNFYFTLKVDAPKSISLE